MQLADRTLPLRAWLMTAFRLIGEAADAAHDVLHFDFLLAGQARRCSGLRSR